LKNVEDITKIEERKIAAKCKIKSTNMESAEIRAKDFRRREMIGRCKQPTLFSNFHITN
jgi:hypothetical protein